MTSPAPASLVLPRPSQPSPAPGSEDFGAFAAIGSRVRMAILGELSTRERSVADLARALGLQRQTLRYHLAALLRRGLIEEAPTRRSGRAGRPATLYRATRRAVTPGFPPRHFEILAEVALQTLVERLGPEQTVAALEARGQAVGRALVDSAAATGGVSRWSPEAFRRLVLDGVFRSLDIESEVLEDSGRILRYRMFTCPFLEIAERMPGTVCDALDAGLHRGIDEGLGIVATSRTTCMGHGAPYCEYEMTWRRRGRDAPDEHGNGRIRVGGI